MSILTASQRIAYGESLVELGGIYPDIVALDADLSKSTMSAMFQQAYPERFFEMGIAEQNMASVAAGLCLAGKIPFISTFAVFASGRMYDQLRQSIAIPRLHVNICGSSSGLSDFGDGATHQAVEDIAIMRAIPNMTVLSPVDAVELKQMMKAMTADKAPHYLRVNRNELPVYSKPGSEYEIGRQTVFKTGADAVIFATGVMVSRALAASDALQNSGISVGVVNVGSIKPMNKDEICRIAAGTRAVVTAEEHNIIGGLGSAVSEALQGNLSRPVVYVGIEDRFGTSAYGYEELLAYYGLTPEKIICSVKKSLEI